jgi:hypothetical protein
VRGNPSHCPHAIRQEQNGATSKERENMHDDNMTGYGLGGYARGAIDPYPGVPGRGGPPKRRRRKPNGRSRLRGITRAVLFLVIPACAAAALGGGLGLANARHESIGQLVRLSKDGPPVGGSPAKPVTAPASPKTAAAAPPAAAATAPPAPNAAPAAATAPPAPAGPTIASGCAYFASWYNANSAQWATVQGDLNQLQTGVNNLNQLQTGANNNELSAVEADGSQLTTDVDALSVIDLSKFPDDPDGTAPSANIGSYMSEALGLMSDAGTAASNGDISSAGTDIVQGAVFMTTTDTAVKQCPQEGN